jgi:hypothetical protein
MTWYLLVFSDTKKAAGYAWGLMGLTAKLAQSVSNIDNGLFCLRMCLHSITLDRSSCVLYPFHEVLPILIGITDRDSVKSKVIPEEVEKRRALFWELMYLDARLVRSTRFNAELRSIRLQSLSLGRPSSLSLRHIDCHRPSYVPDDGYSEACRHCKAILIGNCRLYN